MTKISSTLLLWSPRILGLLTCLFLSLFALDASGAGDFVIHVAPALVLLTIVAVSWRHEWVGGIVFTGLATAYAYFAREHVSWTATISVPLLVVGLLFLWSWRHHAQLRSTSG